MKYVRTIVQLFKGYTFSHILRIFQQFVPQIIRVTLNTYSQSKPNLKNLSTK